MRASEGEGSGFINGDSIESTLCSIASEAVTSCSFNSLSIYVHSAGFVAAGPEDESAAEDAHSAEPKAKSSLSAEVSASQEELPIGEEVFQAGFGIENFELGQANTKVGHIYRAMRSR